MTNEARQESIDPSPRPNYPLRRLGAGAAALIAGAGAVAGFNTLTHHDTVAFKTVQVPHAQPQEGIFPGEITHDAVCDATAALVDSTELPAGVTREDREDLKDSCVNVANDVIERNGDDVTGTELQVSLQKDFFSQYAVTADVIEASKK